LPFYYQGKVDAIAKEMLNQLKNDYLQQKVVAEGGKKDSLDTKLFGAMRDQAKDKGLVYETDGAKY
jgi:hypothetical protein